MASLAERSSIKTSPKQQDPKSDTAGTLIASSADNSEQRIVVVGAGPVGVRFCNELLRRNPESHITLIGNEPYQPYNRVQLTSVLAGSTGRDAIDLDLPNKKDHSNFDYQTANIVSIAKDARTITDGNGHEYKYDKLVLAVGSHPFMPTIPGSELPGVYTFRNLKDTDALYARLASARHVAVVGGGLLGIEAAKALRQQNTQVTLIQQSELLMNRQLDESASEKLADAVKSYGINLITNARISEVIGEERVESVKINRLGSNIDAKQEVLSCNTVLFATGIRANTRLALATKLDFGKGIKIDKNLQTSDPNIYAIGECAEFDDQTWGLVEPGYDQAAVLADRINGGQSEYFGSVSLARLKVIDQTICSIGDIDHRPNDPGRREIIYQSDENECYRKLILKRGRLIGAIGFGDWRETPRVQEALTNTRWINPLRQAWFRLTGELWPLESEDDNIERWPASTIVCQCNSVSVENILSAIDNGAATLEDIKTTTKAGTGCGSCQYLLAKAATSAGDRTREKFTIPLAAASLIAVVIACIQFWVPGLSLSESAQSVPLFEKIWNDKFYKQVTGFTMLGIIVLASLISLRKRIKFINFGDYKVWRMLHGILGVACIGLVMVHTGLHTGNNLNSYLLYNFIAVIVFGALTGVVIAESHRLSLDRGKKLRDVWYWTHLLVTWPLPVLLALHILSVYYF